MGKIAKELMNKLKVAVYNIVTINIPVMFNLWLCHWCEIADGFIGVISFTYINTSFALNQACRLSRLRHKLEMIQLGKTKNNLLG